MDNTRNGSAPPALLGYCENLWSLKVNELRERCRQRNLIASPSPGQAAPSKADYIAAIFLYEKAVLPDLWAEYRPFVAFMAKQPLHRMLEIAWEHFGIQRLHTKALVCNAVIDAILDGSSIPQSLPGFFSRQHRPLVDVNTLQAQMRALSLHGGRPRTPREALASKGTQHASDPPQERPVVDNPVHEEPSRKAGAKKYAELFGRINAAFSSLDSLKR